MRTILALLAIGLSLSAPVASADGGGACADRDKSFAGVVHVHGNVCNDGGVAICVPDGPACFEHAWCTFCPGPVLW